MESLAGPDLGGFRLLVDRRGFLASADRRRQRTDVIAVPSGVSFVWDSHGPVVSSRRPRVRGPVYAVEPCRLGDRSHLLLFTPAGQRSWINGVLVAPVSVLEIGDEVVLGYDWGLVVTRFRATPVRRATELEVGRSCPVCRGPIEADTTVLVCDCGTAVHLQGDEVPERERLECALVSSSCTTCRNELPFEAGYAWLPEDLDVDRSVAS